ncbi:LysR family transcriptional regulator [Shewanella salipaludis]|uniref:LysR family transcriptional regulator n=1 Tax=Shewanella salipaludis TaxID=2723052 RepID=A0A972JNU6_9GAMM|nr:LysR family transcriptional regulator [Shewanella salipaludis]NMH66516.1 LysR family transcriptional regulator [Shewanella salipaludis]
MLDISTIPIFTTVIEQGGFSKAAEKLGISTSAVSKRISRLEAQLGVQLLYRSTRKLSLTEAGERYYEHALQALQAALAAEQAATELQRQPKGVLRISVPMSFGRLHLAPIIPVFLKRYPQISLHMHTNDTWSDVIAEGFDIALRAGELPDSLLIAKKLLPLHSVLCASPEYIAEQGQPETPQSLIKHNCIVSTHHSLKNEWVFMQHDVETKVQVTGNYQVNSSDALRESLLQGLGIGRLPTFIAGNDIARGKLVPILTDYSMPHKILYAVFPERQYLPQKVRVFIDFLTENLGGDTPHWDQWKHNLA